jgi:pyruvate formate lyase activating enzyme
LVYGIAIAANIDPIEKKPLFHFQPGSQSFSVATAGCNFRCEFCQNWDISQITKGPHGRIIGESLPPEKIVAEAKKKGCRSIAYTYTEPTIFFEYAYDTGRLAKKGGLANVFVTNGYQTPETIKEMAKFVDAVNIDLKSFSEKFYQKVCGARLEPVLKSIKLMHKAGIWVEITTLVVPKQNDSKEELRSIAKFIASVDKNIPWHISRFHPDYQMTEAYPTPIETLEMAYTLGKKAGLNYVYLGNIATEDRENTYCPKCGNLAIHRQWYSIEVLGVDKKGRCPKCGGNLNIIC